LGSAFTKSNGTTFYFYIISGSYLISEEITIRWIGWEYRPVIAWRIFGRKFLAMGSIGCGAALGRFSKSTARQQFIRLTCIAAAV
jgi:hypothetical protein